MNISVKILHFFWNFFHNFSYFKIFNAHFWKITPNFRALPQRKIFPDPRKTDLQTFGGPPQQKILHTLLRIILPWTILYWQHSRREVDLQKMYELLISFDIFLNILEYHRENDFKNSVLYKILLVLTGGFYYYFPRNREFENFIWLLFFFPWIFLSVLFYFFSIFHFLIFSSSLEIFYHNYTIVKQILSKFFYNVFAWFVVTGGRNSKRKWDVIFSMSTTEKSSSRPQTRSGQRIGCNWKGCRATCGSCGSGTFP